MKELQRLYPKVKVEVPKPGSQSDKITLRGPRRDIDLCYKHLVQMKNGFAQNDHKVGINVPKR